MKTEEVYGSCNFEFVLSTRSPRIMKNKFVDCFMLMGTALSLKGDQNHRTAEMGRPLLPDVYTTIVNISLTMQKFKIDGSTMEVEIATLLDQKWIDPRLGANVKTRKMAVTGQIWKPKIMHINGKTEIGHNEDRTFWRGFGDEGNVLLSENLLLKTSCTQELKRFPFDKQICELKFGSYRFPRKEVLLSWALNPAVRIVAELELNEFELLNVSTYLEVDIRTSGNFSVAVLQILLQRYPFHYFVCIMLPCLLLTMLNYVSLWISLKHRVTRFSINLTVFAAMVYFYQVSLCLTQIHVPYLKAIDIFVIICKLFSLVTVLEALIIDRLCIAEETDFHLKRSACSQQYPRGVYWTELAIRTSYPVFSLFFLILFSAVYVQ